MAIALFQKSKEVIMALKHCDELGTGRQRQFDYCEFESSLVYTAGFGIARPIQSDLVKK